MSSQRAHQTNKHINGFCEYPLFFSSDDCYGCYGYVPQAPLISPYISYDFLCCFLGSWVHHQEWLGSNSEESSRALTDVMARLGHKWRWVAGDPGLGGTRSGASGGLLFGFSIPIVPTINRTVLNQPSSPSKVRSLIVKS